MTSRLQTFEAEMLAEEENFGSLARTNREGGGLAARPRPGNVHSAGDWEELLLPEIERQQKLGKEVVFRADAAFAKPEIYEAVEKLGLPGSGFSEQGENCPLRRRRRLPTRKLHRGGSMDGGGSGLNRACESKM